MISSNIRNQPDHKKGSFSNIPNLIYHRNTNSPILRNRSFKENNTRNPKNSNINSLRDSRNQKNQQRALSFGSSHSSFMGTSPIENLQISPSILNYQPFTGTDYLNNSKAIRVESEDIILLKPSGNMRSTHESHKVFANPSTPCVSDCYQIQQAQV